MDSGPALRPWIIHSHDTSWHDAGAAVLSPNGELIALASERVGNRFKHSHDPNLAYDYLRRRLSIPSGSGDYFSRFDGTPKPADRHHFNHAAAAYFGSGYEKAAVLIIDGQGTELGVLESTTIWAGEKNNVVFIESLPTNDERFASNSIGHFYTAVGYAAGIEELHSEGKTMGLAAYGRPSRFINFFQNYVSIDDRGLPKIDGELTKAILGQNLGKAFNWPPPTQHQEEIWRELQDLRQRSLAGHQRPDIDDADIAYAGQHILEGLVFALAKHTRLITGLGNLCLAGGVALNCVANEVIRKSDLFENVFVFPAAGDDGQALGKLFFEIHKNNWPVNTKLQTAFLGPAYSAADLQDLVKATSAQIVPVSETDLPTEIAKRISRGHIIGCCRGRSEIGPRALGHRSIFADPRSAASRDRINHQVKMREWYRPVAPIVMEEFAEDYFDIQVTSKFMTFAVKVLASASSSIPAVVHVDGTARIQTISKEDDQFLHDLLIEFRNLSGVPILVNTSFNEAGKPIVETYQDAMNAFDTMGLDGVLIENTLFERSVEQ